jgi:hypothetical protein
VLESRLLVPQDLAVALDRLSVRTAEDFVSYLHAYPGTVAALLNWTVDDVIDALPHCSPDSTAWWTKRSWTHRKSSAEPMALDSRIRDKSRFVKISGAGISICVTPVEVMVVLRVSHPTICCILQTRCPPIGSCLYLQLRCMYATQGLE